MRKLNGENGSAPQNGHGVDALKDDLRRLREEQIARAYAEAAQDLLFMQDLEECMHDFRFVDAQTAQLISQECDTEASGSTIGHLEDVDGLRLPYNRSVPLQQSEGLSHEESDREINASWLKPFYASDESAT